MHIDTVMTDQNITLSNGNAGTVIDALGERQYGRVYINLGTNELGGLISLTFKVLLYLACHKNSGDTA